MPTDELTPAQREYVIEGEPGYGENGVEWPAAWYGLKGFFRYIEARTYKMHYRVFLSRYRSYNLCPECHGTRLQAEALCWMTWSSCCKALLTCLEPVDCSWLAASRRCLIPRTW